ncbi:hypothetical protein I3271_09265 [Photobacterium leiognathi]|uniref:hypothetical protein n=1 Tax=Photobacterium leiognathi TaxID=553611 RepID=UPI001EE14694|nr:hypothetical protein [Photobacterium leiognathi]MCG3884877.1 hypothetical protein [Photobacterium leiognathi]
MFERIAGRSALTPIKPSDVFEDILIAILGNNKAIEHRANGYMSICMFEHELNLVYMIKPTRLFKITCVILVMGLQPLQYHREHKRSLI